MKRVLGSVAAVLLIGTMLAFSLSAIGFTAETVYDSVFVISTEDSIGSGFAMGKNGIITNAHVIENAQRVYVLTHDGDEYAADVAALDYKRDLALLWVNDTEFTGLPIADPDAVYVGDDIYTIGAPENLTYTLTKGIISAKDREIDGQIYLQIDAAINPGNSGGPLLNGNGQVLGVNTLKLLGSEGIGLSIPINAVKDFLIENNIELDETGNVANRIDVSNLPEVSTQSAPQEAAEAEASVINPTNSVLTAVLSVSVLLNVVLIVMLVYQNKKKTKSNTSERTDFEIDIME